MRIGEVADRAGTTAKTMRYYESIELIPEVDRTSAGYRDYSDGDIERLTFIRTAKRLGLRLDEVREVLALREGGSTPCCYVVDVVRRQAADIERRIDELVELRRELEVLLARSDDAPRTEARYCHLVEGGERGPEGPVGAEG